MLVLSDAEAMEALQHLVARMKRLGGGNELLDSDWDFAQRSSNPWGMLSNFELLGFKMIPASALS